MYLNIVDLIDDQQRFALKRLEFSGDTLANMVGRGNKWAGVDSLRMVVDHERPRFVLFSGGGNDIVGDFAGTVRNYDATNDAAWHLDTPVWSARKQDLSDGYLHLVDTLSPLSPVFAHGYDYLIPSNKPVKYDGFNVTGPWVWPAMQKAGIPAAMQIEIGRLLIDWFNDMLAALADQSPGEFAHIDLRGTLAPTQWQNEIHPTAEGFRAIAARFTSELDAKLPELLAIHNTLIMPPSS
jgi:hypothetical protein